jgi:hydrogenase maturation protein HypF
MERRAVTIEGIVQGVGFRPFVHNLASSLQLSGFVKNQAGLVQIEIEGERPALERFLTELTQRPPPLAQIDHVSWQPCHRRGESGFVIAPSTDDPTGQVFISPDVATCPDCRRELFDPSDRRHGYPFLNCTGCGPRLTIIEGAPYDRQRTTMAGFTMCPACQAEYDDPSDRRFHAQPTACPVCGPRLRLCDARGQTVVTTDPLAEFVQSLRSGSIGALKGLGGYHLTCLARSSAAVGELRRRKHRDEKPFAIMVADVTAAEAIGEVGDTERRLLESAAAPIVLLRKRIPTGIADDVAPRNPWLGIMLPYTPLHHLLTRHIDGEALVMTSGNVSDEPIATEDADALSRLAGIADVFLVHDRPIHVRCDDSVFRVIDDHELPLRRSRGYAPRPIELPFECPRPILAVGGQLKGTFALGRGRQAFVSHHLGDLDHYEAYRAFERDVGLYRQLFAIEPQCVAHDSHPDYASTGFARRLATQTGCECLGVQHHHAHLASCLADNGLDERVIGVTLDGTGFGPDGAIWGGEFLIGDYRTYSRAAHLRYVKMPGGDRAVYEPWRMAVAHLADAGRECASLTARLLPPELSVVRQMLTRNLLCPLTSSMGRLFDAAASLAGIRDRVTYEGQAAIEMEGMASGVPADESYPFVIEESSESVLIIDTRPLVRALAEDVDRKMPTALMARRFHSALVDMIAYVCEEIRKRTGIMAVVLTGGVFQNGLLSSEAAVRLENRGFRVYRHRKVPPNDGGLCLGQLAIAAALTNPMRERGLSLSKT